ncbi:MAG: ATP-dependent RNA helicase RhlE [Phycisphaerae bacterium]|nr:MAG: ATP-dependent RNA helicase RhlE [Phycisphaerae bacterium]
MFFARAVNRAGLGVFLLVQFSSLGLSRPLLTALADEGYTTPTPIQAQAIAPGMEGRDLLGIAQTGTGKTAAFALPILHRLSIAPRDKAHRGPVLPRVLIIAPTRELATQIGESFATYGRHTGLTHTVIFGGVSQFHQVRALRDGVDILVATPGRLIDLMEQRLVNLSGIQVFVLDEADRMLDMGFIRPIQRIAAAVPVRRQTMLFSATMPREVAHLAEGLLRDPVRVEVQRVASHEPKIEQRLYHVPRPRKQALLTHLVREPGVDRAVVFTKTKHGADRVARRLNQAGIVAEVIHGNKAQNYRVRALNNFKSGRARVLVATDVAARGLDVDGVTHVFNFDLPMEPEAYVHRIGRTGRAGATGQSISFCDAEERDLLRDIERLLRKPIPTSPLPELPNMPEPMEPDRRDAPRHGPRGAHAPAPHHRAHSSPAPHGHSPRVGQPGHGAGPRKVMTPRVGPRAGARPGRTGSPKRSFR